MSDCYQKNKYDENKFYVPFSHLKNYLYNKQTQTPV